MNRALYPVLAILLINNRENYHYFEGFTATEDSTGATDTKDVFTKDASGNAVLNTVKASVKDSVKEKTIEVQDPSGNIAAEGFDILGTENNLKRGKKSNSIPVSNSIRNSEQVDPYYTSSFDNSYSFF